MSSRMKCLTMIYVMISMCLTIARIKRITGKFITLSKCLLRNANCSSFADYSRVTRDCVMVIDMKASASARSTNPHVQVKRTIRSANLHSIGRDLFPRNIMILWDRLEIFSPPTHFSIKMRIRTVRQVKHQRPRKRGNSPITIYLLLFMNVDFISGFSV